MGTLCILPIFAFFLILAMIGSHQSKNKQPQVWSDDDQDMMNQVLLMDAMDEEWDDNGTDGW